MIIEEVGAITRQVHFWSKIRFYCHVIVKHFPHRMVQECYSPDCSMQMCKENWTWLTISWQKIILLKTSFMRRLSKKNKSMKDNSSHSSSIIMNVLFARNQTFKSSRVSILKKYFLCPKNYTFIYKTLIYAICCSQYKLSNLSIQFLKWIYIFGAITIQVQIFKYPQVTRFSFIFHW